ncbi:MAG TPA: undecaprenyl-diphosphate phosphatase [Euzebyales bacterium]|nr:undecaprenyl-diphosphate phosphatase [Euzebyales bacterium]
MRTLLEAVFLGVVQGLTEFIPVSSSGHLVLVPHFLRLERPGLAFDVALHAGTFGAVVVYFRTDLRLMAQAVVGAGDPVLVAYHRRLIGLLALGSVPIAVAGVLFQDLFEAAFASPHAAAVALLVTGSLLLLGELARARRGGRTAPAGDGADDAATDADREETAIGADPGDPGGLTLDRMGARHALLVGLGQCVALFPGISRSGTTITAGMTAGLTRPAAARFSFLLALPALVGASAVSLPDLASGEGVYGTPAIVAGVVAAFVSGYLAIRWLLALIARVRLTGFAIYCYVVGGASLVALQVLG